jgi:general secretion pathway protein F
MQFEVQTLSDVNVLSNTTVEARDEVEARSLIEARGQVVAAVRRASAWRFPGKGFGAPKAGRLSLVFFSEELLALLNAGLSIVEALEALLEKESEPGTRVVLERILAGLTEGRKFSAVLAEQADIFSPLYVGIVKAAEGTSNLPESLSRFIEYRGRVDAVRNKIISAAIYPAILFVVGGGVALFLMVYVVPRFAEVYQGTGRSLPWMSQLMLEWGKFAAKYALPLVAAFVLALVGGFATLRDMARDGRMASALARLPTIGERLRIYELSRLYMTLGMLTEGGIPIVAAMATAGAMVSPGMGERLARARAGVESGASLSTAFEAAGLATPISLRLLRVGERSGAMASMLSQSALFYDAEMVRWIDRFTRSFEPILMAVIGAVVGLIVVLLYMPIFDLAGSLQ